MSTDIQQWQIVADNNQLVFKKVFRLKQRIKQIKEFPMGHLTISHSKLGEKYSG